MLYYISPCIFVFDLCAHSKPKFIYIFDHLKNGLNLFSINSLKSYVYKVIKYECQLNNNCMPSIYAGCSVVRNMESEPIACFLIEHVKVSSHAVSR